MFNYIYGDYNYRVTNPFILGKVEGEGGRNNSDLLKVSHLGQTMVQAMSKCLALSIALFISCQKYLLSLVTLFPTTVSTYKGDLNSEWIRKWPSWCFVAMMKANIPKAWKHSCLPSFEVNTQTKRMDTVSELCPNRSTSTLWLKLNTYTQN